MNASKALPRAIRRWLKRNDRTVEDVETITVSYQGEIRLLPKDDPEELSSTGSYDVTLHFKDTSTVRRVFTQEDLERVSR